MVSFLKKTRCVDDCVFGALHGSFGLVLMHSSLLTINFLSHVFDQSDLQQMDSIHSLLKRIIIFRVVFKLQLRNGLLRQNLGLQNPS
jgi:hypothetical protein